MEDKKIIFGIFLSLVLITAATVSAVSPNPHMIVGKAYINDEFAPLGTEIVAYDPSGTICATGEVKNTAGDYGLIYLLGDDPDTVEDEGAVQEDTVTFTVDGETAAETISWSMGGRTTGFDLHITIENTCPNEEDQLTVDTDNAQYNQGADVTITGTLVDTLCNPLNGENMALQVKTPLDNTLFVEQVSTDANGDYSYQFALAGDAELGTYTVIANGNGITAETTFEVVESSVCTEDWECSTWDPEVCDITEIQTCTDWTDLNDCGTEDDKPESETRSCEYVCTEDWVYTEWSMCLPSGEQMRLAIDINECGTTENQTGNLTQPCNYTGPENCTNTTIITVDTDKDYYESGEHAAVYGYVLDNCTAFEDVNVSLISELFGDNVTTGPGGVFSFLFMFENVTEDEYTVTASYEDASAQATFGYADDCDADGDSHLLPVCGGDDCNDGAANVYPGASCSTGCQNTGATYDANCACTGGTYTCPPTGGTGGSTTITGGGGYTPPAEEDDVCTPDWECTDWNPEECPETGVQTRLCGDNNECGTAEGRPDVLQNCEYKGTTTVGSVCGDGTCDETGGETCDNCAEDCGDCPAPPTGSICGNGICESNENCESCEADCGECQLPSGPQNAGDLDFTGMVPGGMAGVGAIAIFVVAMILVGYFYMTRNKGVEDDDDDE